MSCFIFVSPFGLSGRYPAATMLGSMSAKRVVIYMPAELVEALNRATAASPQSRSEIICAAVQRHLAEGGQAVVAEPVSADEAFFDRVAEMMQSGLLQPGDFNESPSEEPEPKSKLWIN